MYESQDSDITNLKNYAEYCFEFKEYSSSHVHLFFDFFLMEKYIDFYHRHLVPKKLFQRNLFQF